MKNFRFACMFCCVIFLCGCSMTEESIDGQDSSNMVNIEKENSVEGVKEKGSEAPAEQEKIYPLYHTELQDYNDWQPGDIFGTTGTFREVNQDAKDKRKSWEDKEGNFIAYPTVGAVCYTTPQYDKSYGWLLYNKKGMFREDFPKFCDKTNQKEQVKAEEILAQTLERLQITTVGQEVYYLDEMALNKLSQAFMTDKEYQEALAAGEKPFQREYNKKDSVILITSKIDIGGLPLYFREYDVGNKYYTGSHVRALIKNGKLLWLDVEGAIGKQNESEKKDILDSDTAEEKLRAMYHDVQVKGEINCKNEGIFYVITSEKGDAYMATPAYVFSVYYQMEINEEHDLSDVDEKVLLDAVSGEWIR